VCGLIALASAGFGRVQTAEILASCMASVIVGPIVGAPCGYLAGCVVAGIFLFKERD